MVKLLIYIRHRKKPFEVYFETRSAVQKFYSSLSNALVQVGPISFYNHDFLYCIEK